MVKWIIPTASVMVMLLGMTGLVIHRHNMICMVLCLELMMLGAQSYGVWLAHAMNMQSLHAWVQAIMVISAVEMALGLAIIIMLYVRTKSIDSDDYTQLKE